MGEVRSFILKLDTPACATGDELVDFSRPFDTVHLTGTDQDAENQWMQWVGKHVLVKPASAMGGTTIWHRAPLVVDVGTMQDISNPGAVWVRSDVPETPPSVRRPHRLDDDALSVVGVWNDVTSDVGADSLQVGADPRYGYLIGGFALLLVLAVVADLFKGSDKK